MEKPPLRPQAADIKINVAQRQLMGKNFGNSSPTLNQRTKIRSVSCARETPRQIPNKIPVPIKGENFSDIVFRIGSCSYYFS